MVVLFCALCFIVALAPAEIAIVQAAPPSPPQNPSGDYQKELMDVKHTQALLSTLKGMSSTSTVDALIKVLALQQSGITIDEVHYTPANATISLSGKAGTPDELNAFRAAIERDSRFKDVSVPVGALLGQQGGVFTMSLVTN